MLTVVVVLALCRRVSEILEVRLEYVLTASNIRTYPVPSETVTKVQSIAYCVPQVDVQDYNPISKCSWRIRV